MHSALVGAYQPFYGLLRDALEYALAAHNIDINEDARDEILSVYHDIDVFGDVRDGLQRLADGGYDCYILSNGTPEMLESLVEQADIDGYTEGVISADEVRIYKPAPYRQAAARTGTPIGEIAHTSPLVGGIHDGMRGVRIDRKGLLWGPYDDTPDLTIETFHDLADELGL